MHIYTQNDDTLDFRFLEHAFQQGSDINFHAAGVSLCFEWVGLKFIWKYDASKLVFFLFEFFSGDSLHQTSSTKVMFPKKEVTYL